MKKSLKVIFFGNESLATGVDSNPLVLKALVENGYQICAVVVHERQSTSRKAKKVATIEYANEQKIPLFNPDKPIDIIDELNALKADIGVLVAYGRIIPQEIIDIFPHGIINLHPSMLPKLRGSTPIETAILDGLEVTGVTVMSIAKEMDAGPVFTQSKQDIYHDTTKLELCVRLHSLGADLILEVLSSIAHGTASLSEQNNSKASYTKTIQKSDGIIDWTKSAQQIEREILAYAVWPKSTTTLGGIDLAITSAHCVPVTDEHPGKVELMDDAGVLIVYCADGYLCIESLTPVGKKEMKVKEFINGYKQKLGPQA